MSKLIDKATADKITEKHRAGKVKKGSKYIESEFFSIDTIKELIAGVDISTVDGVNIKHGLIDGKTKTVIELVFKSGVLTYKAMSEGSPCPPDCR